MSVTRHKLIISKTLVATLLLTWLSVFCQHCVAMEQPDQQVTHDHCSDHAFIKNESVPDQHFASDNTCQSAIQDTGNQLKIDGKTLTQFSLITDNYKIRFEKFVQYQTQESPPDQACFLPQEYYTVQLK